MRSLIITRHFMANLTSRLTYQSWLLPFELIMPNPFSAGLRDGIQYSTSCKIFYKGGMFLPYDIYGNVQQVHKSTSVISSSSTSQLNNHNFENRGGDQSDYQHSPKKMHRNSTDHIRPRKPSKRSQSSAVKKSHFEIFNADDIKRWLFHTQASTLGIERSSELCVLALQSIMPTLLRLLDRRDTATIIRSLLQTSHRSWLDDLIKMTIDSMPYLDEPTLLSYFDLISVISPHSSLHSELINQYFISSRIHFEGDRISSDSRSSVNHLKPLEIFVRIGLRNDNINQEWLLAWLLSVQKKSNKYSAMNMAFLDPARISEVFYNLAKLSVKPDNLVPGWLASVSKELTGFSSSSSSINIIRNLPLLGFTSSSPCFSTCKSWLANLLSTLRKNFQAETVILPLKFKYILQSFELMNLNPDDLSPGFMNDFYEITASCLEAQFKRNDSSNYQYLNYGLGLSDNSLCALIASLASLPVAGDPISPSFRWMTAYLNCWKLRLESSQAISPWDLGLTWYSLGQLNLNPDVYCPGWNQLFLRATVPSLINHKFSEQSLAQLIYGCAVFGISHKDMPNDWMSKYLYQVRGLLDMRTFTAAGFSTVVASLGKVIDRKQISLICPVFADSCLSASIYFFRISSKYANSLSSNSLTCFAGQTLSSLMMGLQDIHGRLPPRAWRDAYFSCHSHRLHCNDNYTLNSLVFAITSAARWTIDLVAEQPQWLKSILSLIADKVRNDPLDPSHLNGLLNSLAFVRLSRLDGFDHIEYIEGLIDAVWRNQSVMEHYFRHGYFSHDIHALGLLGYTLNATRVRMIAHEIVAGSDSYPIQVRHRLFLYNQYLKCIGGVGGIDGGILCDSLAAKWQEMFRTNVVQRTVLSSMEKRVFRLLKEIDGRMLSSHYIPEIASMVDFYHPGSKLVIQFDGSSHFLSSGEYDGSSVFQQKLLESCGYRVKRLQYQFLLSKGEMGTSELKAVLADYLKPAISLEK